MSGAGRSPAADGGLDQGGGRPGDGVRCHHQGHPPRRLRGALGADPTSQAPRRSSRSATQPSAESAVRAPVTHAPLLLAAAGSAFGICLPNATSGHEPNALIGQRRARVFPCKSPVAVELPDPDADPDPDPNPDPYPAYNLGRQPVLHYDCSATSTGGCVTRKASRLASWAGGPRGRCCSSKTTTR